MNKKLIFFDSSYPPPIKGGKEKQAHNLALKLKLKNYDVIALTTQKNLLIKFSKFQGIFRLSVPYIFLPLVLIILRFFSNIIHIHTPSRIGIFVLNFSNIIHFKTLFKVPNMEIVGINKKRDSQLLKNANFIICLEKFSYHFLSQFKLNLKESKADIKLFSNMVYLKEYKYESIREKCKLVYSSRLVDQKNPIDFLRFLLRINNAGIAFESHILGEGPLFENIINFAKENKIYEKCYFHGMINDPTNIIARSNFFISTSQKEGMSNSILESMACGVPVLATNIGSSDYLLKDYFREFTFDPGDIESLYKCFLKLYNDEKLLKKYSLYLYKRAKKVFNPDLIANNYENIYRTFN